MNPHTKLETFPYLLIAVDVVVGAVMAALTLPVGALQPFVPVIVLLVLYASGEYSFLSEVPVHPRLGVFLACAFLILACAESFLETNTRWLMPGAAAARFIVAVACCCVLVGSHYMLGSFVRARRTRYLLHLRPDMELAGASLSRHLSRSGYPARVVLDADPGCPAHRLPVDAWVPRFASGGRGGSRTELSFDPASFCDVTLRLLPPAVLSLRDGYVSWCNAGRRWSDPLKRVLDVVFASVLLVIGLPLLIVAALLILLLDGRPVLFRQTRVGRFGVRFSLLKLRTLHDARDPSSVPNQDIEERVFPLGALLRKTRLDELPQLFNILRGDMSLIGPRPEMEYFHARWSEAIPFYRKRLLVRPGLSGWAQVRFSHTSGELDYWDKTAFDLWYVVHRNPALDIRICLRTIGVMLFGAGAR